jgi:hypothetical protein
MGHNGERSRGDSALRGWPEVEWHLVRMAEDPEKEAEMNAPRYFKAYGRDVDVSERRLLYDKPTRRLSIDGIATRKADTAESKEIEIDALVMALVGDEPGIARKQVAPALTARGQGKARAAVVASVNRLVAREWLVEKLGGRSDTAHLLYVKGRTDVRGSEGS